jgi:hypothetical protein
MMSLRRTEIIVALVVAALVANIQAADATELPLDSKPAAERSSKPARAGQPDAAQDELYQQFREWLRKPGAGQTGAPKNSIFRAICQKGYHNQGSSY